MTEPASEQGKRRFTIPRWLRLPREGVLGPCWYCESTWRVRYKKGDSVDFMELHYCPRCRK